MIMKSFYFEKDNKKSLKLVTKVRVGFKINIKQLQRIYLGSCYLAAVMGLGVSAIFYLVALISSPSKVNYLVDQSPNSVRLIWTAPGDDANSGRASAYDIRYSLQPISETNWSEAVKVSNTSLPQTAGSKESFLVTGLSPDTKYYFAIKSVDEAGNWSSISNVVSKKTGPAENCKTDWSCTDWSACIHGWKTRTCVDKNNCGTDEGRPELQVKCSLPVPPPEICQENWSCTDWSECRQGVQTRRCLDLNNCQTEKDKPVEVKACGVGGEDIISEHFLAVTPSSHGGPHLRLYTRDLKLYSQFFTYAVAFRGGVNAALGDVDGDGRLEVITGTGPGSAPHLRIFDTKGSLRWQFFAYPSYFRIGISVATADVDGDGEDEIIVAPQAGGGPHVRVIKYNRQTKRFELFKQFFAYPSHFRLGLNLSGGDLNNNGLAEIVVAPRVVGGPHVRVFEYDPVLKKFVLKSQFFAYAFGFRGGVSLAIGDIDNDGINEIITGAGPGGGPHVRILDKYGRLKYQFFAASTRFRGGVDVTAMDYDSDGADEIITGAWSNAIPGVKVFNFENNRFLEKEFFYAYNPLYRWGIRVTGY